MPRSVAVVEVEECSSPIREQGKSRLKPVIFLVKFGFFFFNFLLKFFIVFDSFPKCSIGVV